MITTLMFLHVAIVFFTAAVFVAAAVSDAHSFRIPNLYCFCILALYPLFVLTAPEPVEWEKNVLVFLGVLAIGAAAFWGKLMGAGDVKLLSVASLWAGLDMIAILLLVTAFVGGIEALVMMAMRLRLPKTNGMRLIKTEVPYGVAIAAGGVVTLGLIVRPFLLME